MTTSIADQISQCWEEHDADAAHANRLAAEMADIGYIAEAIADMERLDKQRDAALLKKAKHPGNSVVRLN